MENQTIWFMYHTRVLGKRKQRCTLCQKSVEINDAGSPNLGFPSYSLHLRVSRQTLEKGQHLLIIRGTKSRHRVPSRHGSKARSPTALVPAGSDVVQDRRVSIQGWVDETDGSLAGIGTLLVDERDDAAECRRRCGGTVDQTETAIDCDDVVRAICGHIGVASRGLRVVVLSRGVGWLVVREVGGDG